MSENGNGFLSKDGILGADDKIIEAVDVPEWGGKVYLRILSAHERDLFDADTRDKAGVFVRQDQSAKMLVRMICDPDGKLLLTPNDMSALAGKSCKVLERLFDVALRINGYTEEAEEANQEKSLAEAPSAS